MFFWSSSLNLPYDNHKFVSYREIDNNGYHVLVRSMGWQSMPPLTLSLVRVLNMNQVTSLYEYSWCVLLVLMVCPNSVFCPPHPRTLYSSHASSSAKQPLHVDVPSQTVSLMLRDTLYTNHLYKLLDVESKRQLETFSNDRLSKGSFSTSRSWKS